MLADEQLHALTGAVAQPAEHRRGQLGEGEPGSRGATEGDQLEAEAEAAEGVAPHHAMGLQRHGQPVRGGPRQVGGGLQPGEIQWLGGEGAEDDD